MMDVARQNARTTMIHSVVILLLVFYPNWLVAALSNAPSSTAYASTDDTNDAATDVDDYESKIQQALSHHATKSHQLLERALEEGGAAAAMEIGPDGSVASSAGDSEEEFWQAEFALQALEHELETLALEELKKGGTSNSEKIDYGDENDSGDSGDDEEYDSGDDEENEYYSGDDDENEYYSGDDDANEDDSSGDRDEYDSDDEHEADYYINGMYVAGEWSGDEFVYEDGISEEEYLRRDKGLQAILEAIDDESIVQTAYEDIRDQAILKAELDPEKWYRYTYWELHAYFSCHRAMYSGRPVYDNEKWTEVRQHWNEFRKNDMEKMPIPEGEPERTYQFEEGSFDPPLTPFRPGGAKGRGLKAARDISKGEMVFTATNNTVIFTHGHTWRKFLFSLYERNGEPYDSGTTCDVLIWSWVQPIEEGGPLVIVADFDNGSLLNEGRENEEGWDPPNVRCGKEGDKMCMMSYYATEDIKEGEELLCDYRKFALLAAWPDMGL